MANGPEKNGQYIYILELNARAKARAFRSSYYLQILQNMSKSRIRLNIENVHRSIQESSKRALGHGSTKRFLATIRSPAVQRGAEGEVSNGGCLGVEGNVL